MGPMVRYPMWKSWLSPFRRSQQKTLARGMAAAASVAQASSLAVAGHLAARLGIQRGRAWNRLLRNPRVDERLRLPGAGRRLRIALDWTEWHHDLKMLVASVIVGRRAIPVQVAAFRKTQIFRSQNVWEHTFLRLLVHTLRETGRTAVLLGDRGFHRVSGLQLLLELKQSFVVRLVADLKVYAGTHEGRLLRHWPLHPGQAVDLGWVFLRQDKAVRVRVLGGLGPRAGRTLVAGDRSARPPGRPGGPV